MRTCRDRARLLANWIESEAGRIDRLGRVRDENRRADELGLRLVHGRWNSLGTGATDPDGGAMLTLLYHAHVSHECIGIIDIATDGGVTLHLRDDPVDRRALKG